MSATDKKKSDPVEPDKLPQNQINPSYTVRVICCVLFIFLTEICLAHYVYRLINSEIRSQYVSKSEFRYNLVNELRTDEITKLLRELQETERKSNRKRRSLGDFDYNVVGSPNDEPHVEFFNPKLRGDLEARDERIRKETGNKGAAPGGDTWIWLSSYSRIPEKALEGYCKKVQQFCPPGLPGPVGPPGEPGRKGHPGPTGLPGIPGLIGPRGFPGPKGEKGDRGRGGLDGRDGVPGEPGFDGMPGRNGHDGKDGEPGMPGRNGTDGKDGLPGLQGPPGPSGPQGPKGLTGPRGRPGKPGSNGTPGTPGINAWQTKLSGNDSLLIPPSIANAQSVPIGIVAREGENFRLMCGATGLPKPTVTWRRKDNRTISMGSWEDAIVVGDKVSIPHINRDHMGIYVCTANNGVPPQVNQTFNLEVYFPPLIRIRNQMVGALNGSSATLRCEIEAFPETVRYWERNDGRLLEDGDKYRIDNSAERDGYKVTMQLTVTRIGLHDYTQYYCISKNELQITKGEFTIYDPRKVSPPPVSSVGKIAVYGPMPPDKVSVEDICGPPIVCPECETEPKCRGESGVSLFDLIKTWEIRPYIEYKFNDSSFPNRTTDCVLYAVGKPVYHRFTDQTYGCWMRDSDPPAHRDAEKYWVTTDKSNDNNKLFEYDNKAMFRKDIPSKNYTLVPSFQGNSHVVYKGSFFYNPKGSLSIIKTDLNTQSSKRLDIPLPRANSTSKPLYKTGYNYIDICVDDNGLWAIFGVPDSNNTGVMKIDSNEMRPQRIWNISLEHQKVGEMFIVCGVLYAVDSVTDRTTKIRFALDLYKNTLLDVALSFTNPFRRTTMIEYNQKHKELYTWDKGNQLTYPVRYNEIGYNYTSREDQSSDKGPTAEMRTGYEKYD